MSADTLASLLLPSSSPVVISSSRGLSLSYRDLESHVSSFRSRASSIKRGNVVALCLPNGLELVVAFLATSTKGAIAAPLNPAYTQSEFEFYLSDSSSSLVLVPSSFLSSDPPKPVVAAARKLNIPILEVKFVDGEGLTFEGGDNANDTTEVAKGEDAKAEAMSDDVALLLHTSGTTGKPKAVPLTHRNLLTSTRNINKTYGLTAEDRTYLVQVLFHIHGIVAAFLSPLASGGSIVLSDKFDPSKAWFEFAEYRCTWITAVPSIHQILLRAPRPSEPLKIRFIRSCSSPLPPSVFHSLEETFDAPVLEAYAMTEAAHQMTSNPAPPAERRPGSVGIGQGVEVRIYDESGKILQPNEHGEVCIRGKNVTNGYLNNQKANSSAFIEQDDGGDHFFRTGDRGFLDKGGYLTLVGRISEIINRGGEKISPIEVDSALLSSSPAIIEAVCFAVPDELLHQEVEAAVVLDKNHPESEGLDENRIQDLVREKISDFKVPKKIHFCEGSIPKGPTGKIQRKNLTAQFGKPSEGKNEPSPSAATNGKESPKKAVIACLAKALLLKEEDVKEDAALFALGADSASFIRFRANLKKSGYFIEMAELFSNPTVSEIIKSVHSVGAESSSGSTEGPPDPDEEPFSLMGARSPQEVEDLRSEISKQIGTDPEDIEDATPFLPNQKYYLGRTLAANNLPAFWLCSGFTLAKGVDLQRWNNAWNKTFDADPCLRSTFFETHKGGASEWNVAFLKASSIRPEWTMIESESAEESHSKVNDFFKTLRHTVGMRTTHFVLATHGHSVDFYLIQSHLMMDGSSRLLLQEDFLHFYTNQSATSPPVNRPPWSRYVKGILQNDDTSALSFWQKDLSKASRLPSIIPMDEHPSRFRGLILSPPEPENLWKGPIAQASSELGVTIPTLVESAFLLALGLYWTQEIGVDQEEVVYSKGSAGRLPKIRDVEAILGFTLIPQPCGFSLLQARQSIWAFVQFVSMKLRFTENFSVPRSLGKLPRSGITFVWRYQDPNPQWDALATFSHNLFVSPTSEFLLACSRVGPDVIRIYPSANEEFISERRKNGCKVELRELTKKTLSFICEGNTEAKTWDDLKSRVFD